MFRKASASAEALLERLKAATDPWAEMIAAAKEGDELSDVILRTCAVTYLTNEWDGLPAQAKLYAAKPALVPHDGNGRDGKARCGKASGRCVTARYLNPLRSQARS